MKLKRQYAIRKIGTDFFAVAITSSSEGQQMIKLNDTGAFLFEQCTETIDKAALVQALLKQYDVSESQAENDVNSFIQGLCRQGLIEEN